MVPDPAARLGLVLVAVCCGAAPPAKQPPAAAPKLVAPDPSPSSATRNLSPATPVHIRSGRYGCCPNVGSQM